MANKVRQATFNGWLKDELLMKEWVVHELYKDKLLGQLSSNSSKEEVSLHLNNLANKKEISIEDYKSRWRKYKHDSTRKTLYAKIDRDTYDKLESLAAKKLISKTEAITRLINNTYRSTSKDHKQTTAKRRDSANTKRDFVTLKLDRDNSELRQQNSNLKTVNDFLLSELVSAQQTIKEILGNSDQFTEPSPKREEAKALLQDLTSIIDITHNDQ